MMSTRKAPQGIFRKGANVTRVKRSITLFAGLLLLLSLIVARAADQKNTLAKEDQLKRHHPQY
jgi:hypothetical protein